MIVPRKISKYSLLAAVFGLVIGLAWIAPVFFVPGLHLSRDQSEGLRATRLVLPMIVGLIGLIGGQKRKIRALDLLLFLALILWPVGFWLYNGT